MPVAANCPGCGAPLSETSVLALAPVCSHCGVVITNVGGTLGLTSAYGINDPTITRKRVEADLAVFCDYKYKYVGMLEACKEQLNLNVEQYAKFPDPPELLPLQSVPPFEEGVKEGLRRAFMWGIPCFCISLTPLSMLSMLFLGPRLDKSWDVVSVLPVVYGQMVVSAAWYGAFVYYCLRPHYKAKFANGNRPLENERRRKAYDEACVAALKAAEPVKAAQDHRLRLQIRELEGLAKTVSEREADVRRILATL